MRATSIPLYSRRSTDDAGNPAYCGCWTVPCPDGDPRIPDLERLNLGRALEPDGTVTRAFFFADEIDEMVARAERETECDAETPWEHGEPWINDGLDCYCSVPGCGRRLVYGSCPRHDNEVAAMRER